MTALNYSKTLVPGAAENTNDLNTILNDIKTWSTSIDASNIVDGTVTETELTASLLGKVGVSDAVNVRRGKSIITTAELVTSTTYAFATTPDRVSAVVLPTDGLMFVIYRATWKESVDDAARAAIFLGTDQLTRSGPGLPDKVCSGLLNQGSSGTPTQYSPLGTPIFGFDGAAVVGPPYGGDVTTGQLVSGSANGFDMAVIMAAAGTYDVSVKFKSTSGNVTVKDRKLWVWTMGF